MYQRFLSSEASSLAVLRYEDLFLKDLFCRIRRDQDPIETPDYDSRAASVERRYRYGQACKQSLRCLAIRQSAAMDVAKAAMSMPQLAEASAKMIERGTLCRPLINELRVVVRAQGPMNLNSGYDFAGHMAALMEMADETIDWELNDAIPLIEGWVVASRSAPRFRGARYVTRHAPTRLNPDGPRWYERAPVVSRLGTLFDHVMELQLT
jgi:hypothetical protein